MIPRGETAEIDHLVDLPGRGRTMLRHIPGPAGAPTVLLLHGLGATGRLNWGRCYRSLSEHFSVLSLDHRGHGRGIRTGRFRLEDCADDAAAAASAVGANSFIAVGYSMGGPIASLTWERHRKHVAGLVFCATAQHFGTRGAAPLMRIALPVAAAAAKLAPGLVQRGMVRRLAAQTTHAELRERIQEELLGHEPASIIQAVDALTRFTSLDWIGDVDVPTAVVVTTRDELIPVSRQQALARAIPGAEMFEVDCGHDACVRSDAFAPTLVRACLSVASRRILPEAY